MEDNKKNTIDNNQNSDNKPLDGSTPNPKAEIKKRAFGTIKPLTALQIISLMVPSNPASAGNCY